MAFYLIYFGNLFLKSLFLRTTSSWIQSEVLTSEFGTTKYTCILVCKSNERHYKRRYWHFLATCASSKANIYYIAYYYRSWSNWKGRDVLSIYSISSDCYFIIVERFCQINRFYWIRILNLWIRNNSNWW